MRLTRFRINSLLAFSLGLLALSGCSTGGGNSLIAIAPVGPQTIDAGQTLPITVSVINDSANKGISTSLTGAGSIATGTTTSIGDSEKIAVNYTAPTSLTTPSTATFIATSNNTPSQTAQLAITINAAFAISTATLPNGTVTSPYSVSLTTTGGTGTVKWAIVSGSEPTGLANVNPTTGVISGTPAAIGTYTFTVSATDSSSVPNTITQTYTVTIAALPPAITPATLPNAVAGTAYSQQLAYTGGSGTAAWSITSGSLPANLTLSTSGLISGTPNNASAGATYTFTVSLTVGTQTATPVVFSITVPALPSITTTSIPSGNVGIAYSQQLHYTGGAGGTVAWAITSGSLPSTITLSPSGLLSGTPTTAATYNFSVTVTVGTQTSAPQAYTLVVNSLIITSGATATGEVGLPFGFHLTAQGGTGPYTWSLGTGSNPLPAGLSLNPSTGYITGSPTTNTGSPFTGITVQATDSLSATATQAMTFTISPTRSSANNAELSGQYAFLLTGFDANGKPLITAGKFTADGNGNITSGVMDTNGTALTAALTNVPLIAATYSVGSDNRGKLVLTTASTTATFTLSVDTITSGVANAGYLTEADTTGQSRTGTLALQTPAAFTTTSITGGFAFGLDGFAANSTPTALVHRATIGELQFNGSGGITSGEFLSSGSASTTPIVPTSAVIAIGTNGRGTLTLTLPGGVNPVDTAIYVVSATKIFLLSIDPASGTTGINDLLSGQGLQQTIANGNFATTSLNSISVLRSERLDAATTGGYYPDAQLGLYTFNNAGKATLTSDEDAGGVITSNSLSGTYTVAANGRVTLALASGLGGCSDCVSPLTYAYLVGANQGFVLDFSTSSSSGYFEPQTATGITATTFSGNYALGTLDPLSPSATYSTGVLTSTGTGSISETFDRNTAGTITPDLSLTATYVVAANGRAVVTQTGSNPVLYLISPTKALALDLSATNPVIQETMH